MKLNDKAYNILKWVAMVLLPAFIVFFKVVGAALAFKETELVATILIAFNAFLGTILGVSTAEYHKEK